MIKIFACTEMFAVRSLCEVVEEARVEASESIISDNVTESAKENIDSSFLNSSLSIDPVEISPPGNDSVTNDTTISNATLIKKFTCLLDETHEENSTFQVYLHTFLMTT